MKKKIDSRLKLIVEFFIFKLSYYDMTWNDVFKFMAISGWLTFLFIVTKFLT